MAKKRPNKRREPYQHVAFNDGLVNFANQLANTRSATGTNQLIHQRLPYDQMNDAYKNGLGNKIVNLKTNTAYKEGLIIDGSQEHDYQTKRIIKEAREASKWMLAFGRGVIAIVEESKDTQEPLSALPNLARTTVRAFDGSMVTVTAPNTDVSSPDYMEPEYYVIRGRMFHPSRIIDFKYIQPREYDAPQYQYGGISEYELIYNQLINDGVVERASAAIIEKNSTLFYKVDGFKSLLQQGKEASLIQYFTTLENSRSIYGAGIVDNTDSIETHAQALTNLQETDMITLRRLAMVTSIPVAILVGESVKGLNATGANEMETFYIAIENLQENYLLEPLNKLFRSLGLGKEVEFNHPEQMTPQERATLNSTIIDNALKLQSLGYDPTEMIEESDMPLGESNEFSSFGAGEEDEDADRTE